MTQRRLGLSVYPDHSELSQDEAYLKLGAKYGFSRIFMSMLEVSEGKEKVKAKYKQLISFAKQLGYETILDVSPAIFEALDISYDDLSFFAELGADGIRLDEGFDGRKEALLSFNPQQLIIELNMSNDVAYLDNILSYEANEPLIYGCHNFYPQDGTGLPWQFFKDCSRRFKDNNIRTAAFITSQAGQIGPWSINDGLPTLESHRYLPVEIQAKELFATKLIDDVIIGNAYASEEELAKLAAVDRYQVTFDLDWLQTSSSVERQVVFENQHFRRGDITDRVIRSTQTRKDYAGETNPPHDNTDEFQRGDVVVGNDKFGKYKNELQIVLEPHSDERKNKVGHLKRAELGLLDAIRPWSKFKFTQA